MLLDNVFISTGKKRKGNRQEKIRMENKIKEIKRIPASDFQIDFVTEGFVLIQLDLKSNLRIQNEIYDTSRYK